MNDPAPWFTGGQDFFLDMINHELKIVLLHPQRTGGTTVQNYFGGITNAIHRHHHAKREEYEAAFDLSGYRVFMTVRNVQDRVTSWYHYQRSQGFSPSIGDAIRSLADGQRYVDYAYGPVNYLLTEFLQYDLPIAGEFLGIPRKEVGISNQGDYPEYDYWSEENLADLRLLLSADIRLYEGALKDRAEYGYDPERY